MMTVAAVGARPSAQTASPGVTFRLQIDDPSEVPVYAIALRCQVRIEPRGRRYAKDEQQRLYELFGDVSQWDRTLQGVTWSQSSIMVPSFDRRIEVDLPVACTYDLEIACAKYLNAIRTGDIPLLFLFSGTVFKGHKGAISVEPVPWDLSATFRMPSDVWHAAMEQFFPGGGWIRLQRETIDRLQAFRGRRAVVTWDEAIDELLQHAVHGEPA
jgi:hypothetical protein